VLGGERKGSSPPPLSSPILVIIAGSSTRGRRLFVNKLRSPDRKGGVIDLMWEEEIFLMEDSDLISFGF